MVSIQSKHFQQTINKEISFKGTGLHSGKICKLILSPAPINYGIWFNFKNKDINITIPACIENVNSTVRGTNLIKDNISIFTIEHLLSAIYGGRLFSESPLSLNFEIQPEPPPLLPVFFLMI